MTQPRVVRGLDEALAALSAIIDSKLAASEPDQITDGDPPLRPLPDSPFLLDIIPLFEEVRRKRQEELERFGTIDGIPAVDFAVRRDDIENGGCL